MHTGGEPPMRKEAAARLSKWARYRVAVLSRVRVWQPIASEREPTSVLTGGWGPGWRARSIVKTVADTAATAVAWIDDLAVRSTLMR
ncbi:hypothetical protein GCM10009749_04570 [Agromyces neolithicus]|uniref:Uncharacterized protein n=1 Tax=Agromyces neolithicus TaxID=269420 RepID=A0ABN2LUL0_9MICO